MAGTATVSVGPSAYVSLGTGSMYISPATYAVHIVAATSQPAATAIGDMVGPTEDPFYFSLAEQVWAISSSGPQNVVVTT